MNPGALLVALLAFSVLARAEVVLGEAPRRELPQGEPAGARHDATPPHLRTRQEVVDLYVNRFLPGEDVPLVWTGSVAGCVAGTSDAAHQQAVIDRINYYRTLAGLPVTSLLGAASGWPATLQATALMMSANGSLSHFPPTSWLCYTAAGANGASNANLALGAHGTYAVDIYMDDFGGGNTAAGHRRWLLYPPQAAFATGDVPGANAVYVFAPFGARPATPLGVAWPAPGYFPYQNLPIGSNRWSFSYPGANFANAQVAMSGPAGALSVVIEPLANGYGDNTLVFRPGNVSYARPSADTAYHVSITNVAGSGVPNSFAYTVTVINPLPVVLMPQVIGPISTYPSSLVYSVGGAFQLFASGGASGNPVTFTSGSPAVCSTGGLNGTTVSMLGAGICVIRADQQGNDNYLPAPTREQSFTIQPATPTVALTSPGASVVGERVTLVATVHHGQGATGTVTFRDGGVVLCNAATLTSGAASCATTFLAASHRVLVASYSGDGNNAPSASGPVDHWVKKASTVTTVISHMPNPSLLGTPITVGAAVTVIAPGSGVPTGVISVSDANASCQIVLPATSCQLVPAFAGLPTIVASYAGDSQFDASTGSAAHVVMATSRTTVSALPSPSAYGQPVTLVARISGTNPTGSVDVRDGTTTLCAGVPVIGGQALCDVSSLSVGAHAIVARYSGDTYNTSSTSASLAHTVDKASTSTLITSHAPDPSAWGAPITVGIRVLASAPGAGTPTGPVTVSDGAKSCVVTLPASTCSFIPGGAGLRTLVASYGGDASFLASSAPGVGHNVTGAVATVQLAASQNPSLYGQSLTLTATVAGQSPTGTATFNNGAVPIGGCSAVPLNAGTAACTTSALPAGAHAITATYSGDANNGTASSSPLALTVGKAAQSIGAMASVPAALSYSSAGTFSLTAVGGGSGNPVVFASTSPAICSAGGTNGATVTMLAAGSCVIDANQAGNANYLSAPTRSQSFGIARAATTTGLQGNVSPSVPAGTSITLTATVGGAAPTGLVDFTAGSLPVTGCSAKPLGGSGNTKTAQCITGPLSAGSHLFTASYAGDANNAGSATSVSQTVVPVGGQACAGFTDVDSGNTFCSSVEWIRNRGVTLGCTSTTVYCPGDMVSRLHMAAFLSRLGTALTPSVVDVEASGGVLDPDASPILCASTGLTATGFARSAVLDAVLSVRGTAASAVQVELVSSKDLVNWSPVSASLPIPVSGGAWSNARLQGARALVVGETLHFGLRVGRLSGTTDLDETRCHLRAVAGNRNPTSAPFDQE